MRAGLIRRLWRRRPRVADVGIVYRLLLVNALLVAVPVVGLTFARMHERQLLHRLETDVVDQAEVVRAMVAGDPAGPALADRGAMLAAAARHTRTRIRLLDAGGRVVADSHAAGPPEGSEPTPSTVTGDVRTHAVRPPDPLDVADRREVRAALAGRYGAATRVWPAADRVYLFSALPIADAQGRIVGVVYATRSTAPVKAAMYALRRWLLRLGALAIAATAIVTVILALTISRPLVRLARAAERIAAGERVGRAPPGVERRDELGQLARAFDRMATELDRRATASRDLAADASHELRAPLTGIRGAAELLRDGAADDPAARPRFLAMILDDADRLDRMVGRLLELARAEAGPGAEQLDLAALLAASAERCAAPVVVEYRAERRSVVGGRAALASAVDNLLANAVAHAAPGTAVRVIATSDPTGALEIAVENRGEAIPPAMLARVWDRFFTTRTGGTGLGLAIVRSAALAHGGGVGVDSAAGRTRFWFTLPAV